jgi:flagellar hook-length control protein FliK
MLDAHQARTAIAEGQNPEKPAPDAGPSSRDDAPVADAAAPVEQQPPADDTAATDDAAALAAAALAAAVPVATAPVEGSAAPAPVATPVVAAEIAVAAPVAPVVSAETAPVVAVAPATAAAAPAAPVAAAAAVAPVANEQVATPATTDVPEVTATDVPVPVAKPAGSGQQPNGGATQQSPDQPKPQGQPSVAPAPTEQARVAAAYAGPASDQQQATAPAAPVASTAPVAPAAPAEAARPAVPAATPVPLTRSAEAVEHVLRLASSRGVTHARIALHPVELGSVDVHIRSTSDGLVARVVAHSTEAVQTLQHAANDLRKSLEEQGLNVLSLDIGQSGERSAGRSSADAGELASGDSRGDAESGADADDASTTQTSTLRLPDGVLVDVLA